MTLAGTSTEFVIDDNPYPSSPHYCESGYSSIATRCRGESYAA
jgi:hypothetical protein